MTYRSLLLMAASAASLLAGQAAAADAAKPNAEVEELVVTGTRAEGRTRLESLAPVDVISTEALARQGTTEMAAALATVAPSLDFPRPAITDGTDSVRPATLRGLAPDQTLVLINGLRRHASALVNVNGSIGRGSAAVDLNAIPTVAIDKVEVLRDGASAQYGSDAIAGVINMHLREAREGGSASTTFGNYDTEVKTARNVAGRHKTDGPTWTVAGWQGLHLGADGFLTLSGEYRFRNPTSRGDLDPRVTPSKVTSRYGDPQSEDLSFYANAGLPVNDTWSLYGFAGYQNRKTDSAANPRLANNANNVLSIWPGGFLPLITTDIDDLTASGGAKGEIGGFKVDAGVVYGSNKVHYGVRDSVNASIGATSPTVFDAGIMQYDQTVAQVDASKPLELGFAKPANLAFGAEYRQEHYEIHRGDLASYVFGGIAGKAAGAQGFPGFKPSNEVSKDRHSEAVYGELDSQITDKFDVDAAVRYENFSDFGSTTTGVRRCGRSLYCPSSTRLGSTRIILTWSGVVRINSDVINELIAELFPAPVAPEISTCGNSARFCITVRPAMSRPSATVSGCVASTASSLANRSPTVTSCRWRFGTSTPIAERPGIGARIRTSGDAMA